jgi:hypothetical protein
MSARACAHYVPWRFAPIGLLDPVSPYPDCPPELARALTAGAGAGKQKMEAALTAGGLAPATTVSNEADPLTDQAPFRSAGAAGGPAPPHQGRLPPLDPGN